MIESVAGLGEVSTIGLLGWVPGTGESVTMTGFSREVDKETFPKFTEFKGKDTNGDWGTKV